MKRALLNLGIAGLPVAAIAIGCVLWLDRSMLAMTRRIPSSFASQIQAITDLGRSHWYLIGAVVLAIFCLSTRRRLWVRRWLFLFAAVAGSGLLVNGLKIIFGRARPIRLFHDEYGFRFFEFGYDWASFPSGHSTTVGAVATVAYLLAPRAWWLWMGSALIVGLSRVAVRAHYPADVAAGLFLGAGFTLLLEQWLARRGLPIRNPNARRLRLGADTGTLNMLPDITWPRESTDKGPTDTRPGSLPDSP